ncbi:MAG: hypothetical protein WB822_05825 [Rhodoplanes sp.]
MSRELWATYSVRDHLEPRGLAADVMLFDRLVFPVPETSLFDMSRPEVPAVVEWRRNPEEWKRWQKEGWEPESQEHLLDMLRPVIRKIPWDRADPDTRTTERRRHV